MVYQLIAHHSARFAAQYVQNSQKIKPRVIHKLREALRNDEFEPFSVGARVCHHVIPDVTEKYPKSRPLMSFRKVPEVPASPRFYPFLHALCPLYRRES